MAMNSSVRFSVDDATAFRTTAQAAAGGAVAGVDVDSAELALDVITNYWENGDNANLQEFAVFGRITEVAGSDGTIYVETSVDGTFGDAVTVASKAVSAAGSFTFVIAKEQLAGATEIRVSGRGTLGTDGLEYWAYAAPINK